MTKDAGQAQQTNRLCQPLSSYEAGYEAGYRDGTVALKAATERAEAAERELRDCDAARTLVLSENERLANELMAMRAGRKAELEALRTKAAWWECVTNVEHQFKGPNPPDNHWFYECPFCHEASCVIEAPTGKNAEFHALIEGGMYDPDAREIVWPAPVVNLAGEGDIP